MQSEAYHDGEEQTFLVGASIANQCHIHELKDISSIKTKDSKKDKDSVKNDTSTSTDGEEEPEEGDESNDEEYTVEKIADVVTDEALKDSCQNVVRFFRNGTRVLTAGEDGKIRVWTVS